MSQQNPWKKQMMQNKAQQESPISKFPPQESTSPPWLKNKQQQPQPNSNPPPWMKNNLNNTTNNTITNNNNSNPSNTSSPSVPPWMKNKQPSTTPNQPAWMKNNTNNNEPQTSNQPAWMKNNNNTNNNESQGSNVPAWKAGGTMFGADKKKKQQQERLRKQQQEKLRLQKEQQERIQRERLQAEQQRLQQLIKQKQQQVIQTKRMAQQQAYSIARQQYDKDLQQQLKHKKSQKHPKTTQKPQPKSSKKPATQKLSQPPSAQSPVTVQYLYHFEQGINQTLEYKERLEQQERLVKVSKGYAEFMEGRIKEIVERDATVQQSSKKVISQYRKNTIINLQQINTQVYYALCQGQQPQPASSTSSHHSSHNTSHQKPNISQQQSQPAAIVFNLSHLQRLLRVFSLHQKLTQTFITLSKKHPSSLISKFRVPLMVMLDYKGIRFLCESYVMEVLEAQGVPVQQCKEIENQWNLVEKQLKDRYKVSVGKGDIMVKKVYVEQLGEEVYMFQLKNWDIKLHLPHPSIEQLTTDYHYPSQYITSQYLTTKLNTIPETQFQVFSKVRTSAFCQLSDLVHLSQAISVVYASCQGEVEGKEFWELILEESEEIWNLIRCAGYKGKLHKNRRLLFVLFEMMTGVRVRFVQAKKSSSRKNDWSRKTKEKITIKEVKCIKYGYAFEKLQINELIRNFEKYLKQNKFQLANHSLSALTSLQSPQNPSPSFQLTIKHSKLLSSTNKPHSAIKLLEEYSKSPMFDHKAYSNIEIKMQLMVLYIRVRKQKRILGIFKQLLQLVEFYYGNESLLNAILYQMLGSYYAFKAKTQLSNMQQSSTPNNLPHIITLYQHALSIILKHYGDQSQHIAQVYLSRSVAFLNIKNLQLFYKDIEHALKIYKTHSKQKDKIAECMVYKGKAKILQGKPQSIKQGLDMIEQSAMLYHKLGYYAECAEALIFVIQVMQTKDAGRIEVIAQQLIDTVLNYVKTLKFVKKTLHVLLSRLDQELERVLANQDKTQGKQDTEGEKSEDDEDVKDFPQLLNKLEEILKGFSSFAQMIRWLGFTANHTLKDRFNQITSTLTSLMSLKQEQQKAPQQQQQSEEEQPNKSQEPSQINSKSQKQLFKGFSEIHSQQSETSPIKRYKQDLDDRSEDKIGYVEDEV